MSPHWRNQARSNPDEGRYVTTRAFWAVSRSDGEPVGEFSWHHGGHNPEQVDWSAIQCEGEDMSEPTDYVATWLSPSTTRTITYGAPCESSYLASQGLPRGEHSCSNCGEEWSEDDYEDRPPVCTFRKES